MYGTQSQLLVSGIAAGADGDGGWIFCGNWVPTYSIDVTGIVAGDKVKIWYSNNASDNPPTASTFTAANGALLGFTEITADGITAATEVHSWICAQKSAHAGGGAIVVRASTLIA